MSAPHITMVEVIVAVLLPTFYAVMAFALLWCLWQLTVKLDRDYPIPKRVGDIAVCVVGAAGVAYVAYITATNPAARLELLDFGRQVADITRALFYQLALVVWTVVEPFMPQGVAESSIRGIHSWDEVARHYTTPSYLVSTA